MVGYSLIGRAADFDSVSGGSNPSTLVTFFGEPCANLIKFELKSQFINLVYKVARFYFAILGSSFNALTENYRHVSVCCAIRGCVTFLQLRCFLH